MALWTVYESVTGAKEASHSVNFSFRMIKEVGEINEGLSRAESAQRGYLLSGSDIFLAERDKAFLSVGEAVANVRTLISGNAAHQDQVARLEELIAQRIAIMHENAQRRATGGIAVASARAATGVGQQASAKIYALTAEMEQQELRRLEIHGIEQDQDEKRTLITLAAAALVSVLVVVPGYVAFVVQARARDRAERKLLDMTDSVPGAIYQLRSNPDGSRQFEFLSAGVTALRSVDRDAALRDFAVMWNTIVDEDKPAISAVMAQAERTLSPTQYDFRVKQSDGSVKWLRASATLRKEADGSILWNGYWADVTIKNSLERALEEAKEEADSANRAKSTFLATMSHEIRTPMNGVMGMLELLSLTSLDTEQRTTLEIVRESGKSLLRIIDDILDFSKIEAGKLEVRAEVASIKAVIESVHNIYLGSASNKGLLLTSDVDPKISPAVWVDPLRLRQILNNLVSNAIKFTPEGQIEIRAELVERTDGKDRLRISVQDTGIGIAAEARARLFQPFMQASAATTRQFGGTGLGLAICHRLAKVMGGSIEAASEVGQGTTMILTLSLPIADANDLPKAETKGLRESLDIGARSLRLPSVAEARLEGSLVLLVDDHPINRMVLQRQLNTLGYATECAENGVEAWEKWRSGRFGLVVTDCNMPELDGYGFTRRIRALESERGLARVPIIACTANALGGEAHKCFAAGMDDYLAKPVGLPQLARKLDHWLPRRHAEELASEDPGRATGAAPGDAGIAPPFDRSVLAELCGGDLDVEREILLDFRRVNDADAGVFRHALAGTDISEVARVSHRIKGAGRTVGALALAGVCERIERASRANDWETVEVLVPAFDRELVRVNAIVDALGAVRRERVDAETSEPG